MAMPEDSVGVFRASVPMAVTNALQVARSFREDRARFEATFKKAEFDPAELDDLEQRALALLQADVEHRLTARPEQAIVEYVDEATWLRRLLLRAAEYLWGDDPEVKPKLVEVRQGRSHMNTADALHTLPAIFEVRWSEVEGRCEVTRDHLSRARELSHQMLDALAQDRQRTGADRARDLRDRAAAYLHEGVQQVRSAAGYVFWKNPERLEDYPGLYHGRKMNRRPGTDDGDADSSADDFGADDHNTSSDLSAI